MVSSMTTSRSPAVLAVEPQGREVRLRVADLLRRRLDVQLLDPHLASGARGGRIFTSVAPGGLRYFASKASLSGTSSVIWLPAMAAIGPLGGERAARPDPGLRLPVADHVVHLHELHPRLGDRPADGDGVADGEPLGVGDGEGVVAPDGT